MSLASLHPALFTTAIAAVLLGCSSSPSSSSDATASTDPGTPTASAAQDPDPASMPAPDPAAAPTPPPDPAQASSTDMIANGQNFAMQPGGQVTLSDNSMLRYVGVREDSRCKPGQQCIWAGDAVVAFEWAGAEVILHTGIEPRSHERDSLRLSLKSLGRGDAPEAQLLVDAAK